MENVSLYRKYRPHNFDNLVGQEHVKTTLVNALKSDRVSHAYLFSGPRGTGKTSTARLLAKALICPALTEECEPCNECEFCKDINEGNLIDLIEIDAASNRGIDEVRDLKEKINYAPTRAAYKIYIIDEVHMMTTEAFNALLKTLEEPPDHAYFILATTEIHKIPATIISRCQRFDFKRIDDKALMTRLCYIAQKEEVEAEDKALEVISHYVDGGLRDAIGLFEQLTVDGKLKYGHVHEILGVSDISLLEELYEFLVNNDTKEALNAVHELHGQGSDLKQFLHEFIDLLRNKMLNSVAKEDENLTGQMLKFIGIFQEASEKFNSSIPQLSLEIAVIRATQDFAGVEAVPKCEVKYNPKVVEKSGDAEKSGNTEEPVPAGVTPKTEEVVPEIKTDDREHASISKKLTLENLIDQWPRITERIASPSLRMSIKNAAPVKVEGADVTIQFSTNFHKDKVMEHDHRVELEGVIKELFGQAVKIVSVVKELEIKPVVEADVEVEAPPAVGASGGEAAGDDVASEDSSRKNSTKEALDIFGGEVVG